MLSRLGEHSAEEFLGIGISTARLNAEVPFHRLHPKNRRALGVVPKPENPLIVNQSGTHGVQSALGGEHRIRHDGVAGVFDLAVAEFAIEAGRHRRKWNFRAGEIGGLLKKAVRHKLAHLVHRDRGAVGRKGHFAEPLGPHEQKTKRQAPRTASSQNQALRPPGCVALRSRRGGISKSQPRENENPPTEFHPVERHIHHSVQDRRQRGGNQAPTQRPGGTAPEWKHIPNQHDEQGKSANHERKA